LLAYKFLLYGILEIQRFLSVLVYLIRFILVIYIGIEVAVGSDPSNHFVLSENIHDIRIKDSCRYKFNSTRA
jgi:hypothetical protein